MRFSLLLADIDNPLFDFNAAQRAAFSIVAVRFGLPDDTQTYTMYQNTCLCA